MWKMIRKNVYQYIEDNKEYRLFLVATSRIKEGIESEVYNQALNVYRSTGIKYVCLTPDVHSGYFVPIGCIAVSKGFIYPGAVGFDIGCGMRFIYTDIKIEDIGGDIDKNGNISYNKSFIRRLVEIIDSSIPTGFSGRKTPIISKKNFIDILYEGVYAIKDFADYDLIEAAKNNTSYLMKKYGKKRIEGFINSLTKKDLFDDAMHKIGTLGGGNHFLEIQVITWVNDEYRHWGLREGHIGFMIHSGSRHFGHQICSYALSKFQSVMQKYNLKAVHKEGVFAPVDSAEAKKYISLMNMAINYAVVNRHFMANEIIRIFQKLGFKDNVFSLLYDISHNVASYEEHSGVWYWVHRKGATKALPPKHKLLKGSRYEDDGHPVILPGAMGKPSYIMVGDRNDITFHSINHGAGRVISRKKAFKKIKEKDAVNEISHIVVNVGKIRKILDEMPSAYKDIEDVVEAVEGAGIAKKVAKLSPIASIKGT